MMFPWGRIAHSPVVGNQVAWAPMASEAVSSLLPLGSVHGRQLQCVWSWSDCSIKKAAGQTGREIESGWKKPGNSGMVTASVVWLLSPYHSLCRVWVDDFGGWLLHRLRSATIPDSMVSLHVLTILAKHQGTPTRPSEIRSVCGLRSLGVWMLPCFFFLCPWA